MATDPPPAPPDPREARQQLADPLSLAEDEGCLRMIWAARAIQSGQADAGLRHMRAVALRDRAESCTRLDRLQLLRIADKHDLGATLLRLGDHSLHLPCPDHAGLVDDEHIVGSEQLPALLPLMLQACQRARLDARARLKVQATLS